MSIKLPSALTITGAVVDTAAAIVSGFKVRAKLLAPDGSNIATVLDGGTPIESATGADGSFSLKISDASVIKQLMTQGYSLLFKSGADDTADKLDAGLTRATPLHVNARQSVRVVLEWQAQQAGDMTKPPVSAKLRVRSVARDGQPQSGPLVIKGLVEGPQGLPTSELTITASLVVPGTGQTVEFPQPDNRPTTDTSTADGRFQITLGRAGDLVPSQPYSMYGIRFSARPANASDRAAPKAVSTSVLCHINSTEATLVKLRWDATDPANPQLSVACVHRNGTVCQPAEGTMQALGQLLASASSAPLANYRVQIQAGPASKFMGEVQTNAQGYFSLLHPWPLAWAAEDVSMQWTLQVRDPAGNSVATGIALAQDGLVDAALPVRVTLQGPTDQSPTIAKLLTAFAKTVDSTTQAALDGAKIKTLQDVISNGGLHTLKGTAKADEPTLTKIERAADLWSLLPASVAADNAVSFLATWLRKSIQGTADLGNLPRAAGTAALKAQLGDFAAAQTHSVAVARNNLLNFLLLGARIDAAGQGAKGAGMSVRGQTLAGGKTAASLLPAETQQSCSCEACQTTVSPNAYLMDLIRYTDFKVSYRADTMDGPQYQDLSIDALQTMFLQPFADLPASCASMEQPVLTTRIAIEILRAYGASMTLPSELASALANNEAAYRQRAYDAILSELGTSQTELRLALSYNDQLSALADRLSLPTATQVQQLLLSSTDLANETLLESRFGLRASTRTALDAGQPTPDLLTWRIQRLQSGWLAQDAPKLFPGGVPILDPDVLDFSNLRQGWDSTAPSTVLWTARRAAVDAQLAARATSRAMAIGRKIMTITQTGVMTPSDDQKWAAYLTGSLSDDEVQSMAAVLPPDQQDQAKLAAAQKKVLAARVARGSMPPLTSDETTTLTAVLNYVGTSLSPAIQTASQSWLEDQFTALAPTSGSAIATIGGWIVIQTVLKGAAATGSPSISTVKQDLARFNFTVDSFLRAFDLRLKLLNQGFRALLAEEWAEFDAIFVAIWKAGQVATWVTAEQVSPAIQVTATLFWQSPDQPTQRKWLGSAERYQQWLSALESALNEPIINPALIHASAFQSTSGQPFTLWTQRATWLANASQAVQTARTTVDTAMTGKLALFDDKILAASLLIPKLPSAAHLWYEPDQLQAAYDQGTMTGARLDQLLLNRSGFQALFALRSLIRDSKAVTDQEWNPALLALLKTELQQQYGSWQSEEVANHISLSPIYFQLPAPQPLVFPPQTNSADDPSFLFTKVDLQQWRGILSDRIAQQASISQEQSDMIDRVEQAVLGGLRDALLVYGAAAGFPWPTLTDALSDRFLFDFADSSTNKTTRVAQAISSLQLLLFGLRNGDIFRFRASPSDPLYPTLVLEAEHFDTEWQWMGSYGSWRSALFIFMYPENLLYPTLRAADEKSQPFKDLTAQLQEGGPITPELVCQLALTYKTYIQDLESLVIQATCVVQVLVPNTDCCLCSSSGNSRTLRMIFARGASGRAYWSYGDEGTTVVSEQSTPAFTGQKLWQPIQAWPNVVQIYGAVPFLTKAGRRLVTLIAVVKDKSFKPKLQLVNVDLSLVLSANDPLDSEAKDLTDLPMAPDDDFSLYSFAVEQVVQESSGTLTGYRPIFVHVGISEPGSHLRLFRRALNEDATDWGSGGWVFKFLRSNCLRLRAAFTLTVHSWDVEDRTYQFVTDDTVGVSISTSDDPNPHHTIYWATFAGVVLLGERQFGWLFALVATSNGSLLVGYNYWGYYGYSYNPGYYTYLNGTSFVRNSFTAEIGLNYPPDVYQPTPVVVVAQDPQTYLPSNFYAKLTLGNAELGLTVSTLLLQQLTLVSSGYEANFGPATDNQLTANRRTSIESFFTLNQANPAMLLQLYDMYFAVPMQLGLQLQQSGYYQHALDWFRSIYDYESPLVLAGVQSPRKIYYGLVLEESENPNAYARTQSWIEDPFNPHAIAALRSNAYTRFTELAIIRCLLDYADSEFASDTSESVPRARSLYLDALQLLGNDDLAPPAECQALVASMDFSFIPTDWRGVTQQLQTALVGAMSRLSPAASAQLQSGVTGTLKDTTTPKWGDRFVKAFAAVKAAVLAAPKPPKLSALIQSDRNVRAQAQLALLSAAEWQHADAALQKDVRRRFRATVSDLTGVDESLLAGDSTLQVDWLSKPSRTRRAALDPAQRSPVLVQPERVISRAFKQRWRWDPLAPTRQGMLGQARAEAPALALASADVQSVQYLPTASVNFCIPPNPVINALRLRGQLNLYKLRSGRNISGVQRQLDFYAAPTDAQSGLPGLSANGGLAISNTGRLTPTEFRYATLVERARRQAQLAAQFESLLLQSLEKADNQRENLLRARNELSTQRATLNLKNLEVQEAQLGVSLIKVQQARNAEVQGYLQGLINEDINDLEKTALSLLGVALTFQISAAASSVAAATADLVSGSYGAGFSAIASAFSSSAAAVQTVVQGLTMMASFVRRKQDWQQQQQLTQFDSQALNIQFQQADLHVQIKQQETNIVNFQIEHAQSVVDFLVTKFTNVELFEWMSRVLQGLYSEQLQQATATARLAQQQLAFDLLQDVQQIQTNYWTVPVQNALPGSAPSTSGTATDRKGLTGSERLQSDIEQLDTLALQQTTRKLQLARTISLATVAPGDFQRLIETGEMWFQTTSQDFDLEFPGQYFRRIHKVKVSVLALVPPTRGIRATLSNLGPSRVVVPGTAGFVTQILPPSNDSVSYTSPQNASGLFDLDIQPDLNFPFEGVGVETLWHFEMPMPANPLDFNSIADVQITFEYTARFSADYRAELLGDALKLPRTFSGVRVFSFRNELVDQWYALHNPPPAPTPPALTDLHATFGVDASDFPAGLSNVRATRLTLYMPIKPDASGNTVDLSKDLLSKAIGLGFGANAAPAVQNLDASSLIAAQTGADPWFLQLPKTLSPFGSWTLMLPGTQAILDLLRSDQIRDIIFAISYKADLPDWPTGARPKRVLF